MIENTALSIPIFVSIGDISHIQGAPSDEELEIIENNDLQGLEPEEAPFQEELGLDVIHGRELGRGGGSKDGGGMKKKGNRKGPGKNPRRKRGTRHKRNKRRGSRKVSHILVQTYLILLTIKPNIFLSLCVTSTMVIKGGATDVVGSLGLRGESSAVLLDIRYIIHLKSSFLSYHVSICP